jgi:hypothetical protein
MSREFYARIRMMESKQRFLAVLKRSVPDRLPVTTHHIMPYFLEHTMGGISVQEFFAYFGLDPIHWIVACRADGSKGEYFDLDTKRRESLESPFICSENWIIKGEILPDPKYKTVRFHCITPDRALSMVLQSDDLTTWVTERLIKEKSDIDIFAQYAPVPLCDVNFVNQEAESFGDRKRHAQLSEAALKRLGREAAISWPPQIIFSRQTSTFSKHSPTKLEIVFIEQDVAKEIKSRFTNPWGWIDWTKCQQLL